MTMRHLDDFFKNCKLNLFPTILCDLGLSSMFSENLGKKHSTSKTSLFKNTIESVIKSKMVNSTF